MRYKLKNVNSLEINLHPSETKTMAHLLTPPTATPIISTRSKNKIQSFGFQKVKACNQDFDQDLNNRFVQRRSITLGLAGAILGLNVNNGNASAAARRPSPPPQEEKKDPNVSGVLAKVLASKKRKEAMKEAMGKLREKGKPIIEPSQ